MEETRLVKVRNDDPEAGEQFVLVTVDWAEDQIKWTSPPMTESEARRALVKLGRSEVDIELEIRHARKYPG